MINTAVILAAGMGTRLRKVLKNVPKGFLEIEGNSLIKLSVEKILNVGISKVVIVTGYLSEYYVDFAQNYNGVELVQNKSYFNSGSMYSLYCAKGFIEDSFLLLESDLVYEQKAIEELIYFHKENAILLSGFTNSGDEVYVETENDKITDMSKDKSKLNNITGELVGISKISYRMFKEMINNSEEYFKSDLNLDYEYCIVDTAKKYPVYYIKIDDLIWAEIDDESHLNRVKKQIYPRLKGLDK